MAARMQSGPTAAESRGRALRMALLCAGIATLAAVAAAFGVFARGDGSVALVTNERGVTFEMATTGVYAYNAQRLVAEGVGWDVFTLAVAAPALLLTSVLVARGSLSGRLLAVGLLAYFFYAYLEYAVTWAFGPLFLPFILVFGASFLAILWIGANVVRSGVTDHFADGFPRRSWAAINVAMSGLLTVLWLGRIAAGLQGDLLTAGLTSETTLTVQALDLGLVVPVSLLSAFLAWRRVPVGQVLAAAWSVTFVAMAAAIVSMLISAGLVEGQFEIAPMAIFGVAALAAAAIGLRMYRGLGPGRPPRPTASAATTAASAGGG